VDDRNQEEAVKKVVLITGASAGLGLALAQQLIQEEKYKLVLTSKSSSQIRFMENNIISSRDVMLRELDILDHRQITKVVKEITEKLGGVDILINNAGIAESASVEDSEDFYRQQQLDVNYLAPFQIISLVLEHMREKKWGRIINISSAGGFMAMPTMSSYSASKFALEGATESLWYEMKPWGISVTLVIPGFIQSLGYLNTKKTVKSELAVRNEKSIYFEHYAGMAGLIAKSMRLSKSTNKTIAKRISSVLSAKDPPLRVYVTKDAWLLFWLRKLCPPIIYHYLMFKFLPNIFDWGPKRLKR